MRRTVRRNALALRAAKTAIAARHDRAAQREQDRVIAREAPFRFEQNKSTKLRSAIEGIDDITLLPAETAELHWDTFPVSVVRLESVKILDAIWTSLFDDHPL